MILHSVSLEHAALGKTSYLSIAINALLRKPSFDKRAVHFGPAPRDVKTMLEKQESYLLVELLTSYRGVFLDVNVKSDHTLSLGALCAWRVRVFSHLSDLKGEDL